VGGCVGAVVGASVGASVGLLVGAAAGRSEVVVAAKRGPVMKPAITQKQAMAAAMPPPHRPKTVNAAFTAPGN
jgi:hypothetical protein